MSRQPRDGYADHWYADDRRPECMGIGRERRQVFGRRCIGVTEMGSVSPRSSETESVLGDAAARRLPGGFGRFGRRLERAPVTEPDFGV